MCASFLSVLFSKLTAYRPDNFEGCGSPDVNPAEWKECGVMADLDSAIHLEDSSDCISNDRTVSFAIS